MRLLVECSSFAPKVYERQLNYSQLQMRNSSKLNQPDSKGCISTCTNERLPAVQLCSVRQSKELQARWIPTCRQMQYSWKLLWCLQFPGSRKSLDSKIFSGPKTFTSQLMGKSITIESGPIKLTIEQLWNLQRLCCSFSNESRRSKASYQQ